ncbi:MAG: phenylacetic acid degradation operon negative regulatory protein [Paracoccaceae bacterium]|jgi:phenylacetic acid degradation operon negative regulatory protein
MLQKNDKTVSPRGLVMSLFNAPETSTLTIGQLIIAAGLFEIEATTIRMTVSRLIKEGLIASIRRGVYQTGKNAEKLNSEIRSWRTADKKTKHWNGDWLMALTNHLGRSNKTRLQSMVRALELYGFVEIEVGVWIRPANLRQNLNQLNSSLVNIGLDSQAYLISLSEVALERQQEWHSNWPVAKLSAGYEKIIKHLDSSLNRLKKMSSQDAARESLVVGESAIRLINLDPLLPKEIIDTTQFRKLVRTMIAYDKVGHAHWQSFLSSEP